MRLNIPINHNSASLALGDCGVNNYTFTGRTCDPESGLLYFRARMYSPEQGRFVTRDPIGYPDGWNWYAGWFVWNKVDPTGRCICGPDITTLIVNYFNKWSSQNLTPTNATSPFTLNREQKLEDMATSNRDLIGKNSKNGECPSKGCEGTVTFGGQCISIIHLRHLFIIPYLAHNAVGGSVTAWAAGEYNEMKSNSAEDQSDADRAFNELSLRIAGEFRGYGRSSTVRKDELTQAEVYNIMSEADMDTIAKKMTGFENVGQYKNCEPCEADILIGADMLQYPPYSQPLPREIQRPSWWEATAGSGPGLDE